MARATSLDVWLYGTHIATVHDFGAAGADRPELTWSAEAVGRWGVGSRLLSAKLPIGRAVVPALVRNYLDGLLPEGNARINHALAVGITPDDTFGLMAPTAATPQERRSSLPAGRAIRPEQGITRPSPGLRWPVGCDRPTSSRRPVLARPSSRAPFPGWSPRSPCIGR